MTEEQQKQPTTFDIRKVYIKDASLESPNAPNIFLEDTDRPDISIDANIKSIKLEQEDYYEINLHITVTAKKGEKTAFLAEVQQCGVFQIVGLPEADLPLALQIACPNMLLPFAREAVCDLVGKAGFPQLLLSPINFEGLYMQKQQQLQAAAKNQANNADESSNKSNATSDESTNPATH